MGDMKRGKELCLDLQERLSITNVEGNRKSRVKSEDMNLVVLKLSAFILNSLELLLWPKEKMKQLCLALDSISKIQLQTNHTMWIGLHLNAPVNRRNGLVYSDIHLLLVLNLITNGTSNGAKTF